MTPPFRRFRPLSALACAFLFLSAACADTPGPLEPDAETIANLTITAQPGTPTVAPVTGYTEFGLATPRDGFMYVPASYDPATAAPLLVLLHGANGSRSAWANTSVQALAQQYGMIVVAIDSRYQTWDLLVTGRYQVDPRFLNDALTFVFARVNVNPARIAIGGFSDGASEALGIGVANAGLFRHILAFSPGMLMLPFSRGYPEVFVSHGDNDPVLSFPNTRDVIVPRLESNGMAVQFVPFFGGHELPPEILNAGVQWFLGS